MVYIARTDPLYDTSCFDAGCRLVSADRQMRVDRCHTRDAKCRSLGVGLLLRHALALHGVTDAEIRRDARGKPFLVSHPDIHISLSHSGRVVMCALSDRPVGCDVQKTEASSLFRVSHRFLTDAEKARLKEVPAEQRVRMLARWWTLKESVVKLTGDGLRTPLSSFELSLGERVMVTGQLPFSECVFSEYTGIDGYHLAVCGLSETVGEWRELPLCTDER